MTALDDEHSERRLRCVRQTSASQIDLWERCPRKWFYSYVAGLKPEQTPAQREGVEVDDDYVQPYLRTGRVPDGRWAELTRLLMPHLPRPQTQDPDLLVQHRILLPTYDGGPQLVGFPDMAYEEDGLARVDDLKTTTDFRYCKSADELRDNTQMVAYARWVTSELGADRVGVAHVYGRRKAPHRAHRSQRPHAYDRDRECRCAECREWLSRVNRGLHVPVSPVILTKPQVDAAWTRRVETVRLMVAAADSCADPGDLEPNTAECPAWGGCPHRKACGIAPSGGNFGGLLSIRGTHKEGRVDDKPKMTLKERLAAAKARGAEPPTAANAPATAAPAAEKVAELPACAVCRRPSTRQVQDARGTHLLCAACDPPGAPATGVLPPDAPSRESTPEEIRALDESKAKRSKAEKVVKIKCPGCGEKVPTAEFSDHYAACAAAQREQAASAAPLAPPAATPPAPALQIEVPLREASQAGEKASPDGSSPWERGTSPAKQAPERAAPPVRPTIYVDIAPIKWPRGVEPPVPLADWLAPIARAVAEHHELEDLRLGPFAVNGSLAAAIRESLGSCPAALLVDSGMHGAKIALEVIGPHALAIFGALK